MLLVTRAKGAGFGVPGDPHSGGLAGGQGYSYRMDTLVITVAGL